VVAATDPNPAHAGKGFEILRAAGVRVESGLLAVAALDLNKFFNHWITRKRPFVTVKAAMTLDGKIATARGDSKWITSEVARTFGMRLRGEHDAILVGVETILADDPGLTFRPTTKSTLPHTLRRIVLDSRARTPLGSKLVTDDSHELTTVVVGAEAPQKRVQALARRVNTVVAPLRNGRVDLVWLLRKLGDEQVTSLLVEGGGEINASFLMGGLAQEVAFFYAPKVLGGRSARKGVAGDGASSREDALRLVNLRWRKMGPDLLLRARVKPVEADQSSHKFIGSGLEL
jgi:diaminohydroxyphosphoribosylaminopyrimidine deaminase/5-amino-6-(5-phosphoribosylamino)uracil reductase